MPVPIPGRIAEALRRSTALVRSGGRTHNGNGSAVVLADDLVVTNAHVIQGRELTVESWEGRSVVARLVRLDRTRDLALLEVKGLGAPSAQLGDSDLVRAGTAVIAIGNPLGFTGAVSSGIVHATSAPVHTAHPSGIGSQRWICADLRLAPGNSGGPLADLRGQVIGINTMVISGGLALAVPSRSVQMFLAQKHGKRSLGVTLRALDSEARSGILLLEVEPDGPASRASLLPGDILVAANGRQLQFADDLQNAMYSSDSSLLAVEFYRGGEKRLRKVTIQLTPERVATAA